MAKGGHCRLWWGKVGPSRHERGPIPFTTTSSPYSLLQQSPAQAQPCKPSETTEAANIGARHARASPLHHTSIASVAERPSTPPKQPPGAHGRSPMPELATDPPRLRRVARDTSAQPGLPQHAGATIPRPGHLRLRTRRPMPLSRDKPQPSFALARRQRDETPASSSFGLFFETTSILEINGLGFGTQTGRGNGTSDTVRLRSFQNGGSIPLSCPRRQSSARRRHDPA